MRKSLSRRVEPRDLGVDIRSKARCLFRVCQFLAKIREDALTIERGSVRLPRPTFRGPHDAKHLLELVAHMARIRDTGLRLGESFAE